MDLTGIGLEEAHDVLEGDGLSDTAAAEDAEGFTGFDEEADFVENSEIAEGLADLLKRNVGRDAVI